MPEIPADFFTTRTLMDALIAHYRKPGVESGDGEVLLSEVQAPGSNRRCDLLRIGLWPSRGYGIDVHELKVSRSDWLRELADPGKADSWWPYSSRFWVVAPAGVVQPEELPPGWGLLTPPARAGQRRFKVMVQPETRTPQLTVQLVGTLINRVENLNAERRHRLTVDHRNELHRAVAAERTRQSEATLDQRTRERLELLTQLESWLGVELDAYPWKDDEAKPMEVGTAMRDYVHDHIALQRRQDALIEREGKLRRAAETVLNQLRETADA